MNVSYYKCYFKSSFKEDNSKIMQIGKTKIDFVENYIHLNLKKFKENDYYNESEAFSVTRHTV